MNEAMACRADKSGRGLRGLVELIEADSIDSAFDDSGSLACHHQPTGAAQLPTEEEAQLWLASLRLTVRG
jgi:hypothetical protein